MQPLIEFAIRWRWALTLAGLIVLAGAYPLSTRLKTDQSVTSLFADGDQTLRDYRTLKSSFGKNDVLVLMYRDASLASESGMQRSKVLTEKIKSLDGVTATLSPWVLNQAAEGMSAANILTMGLAAPSTSHRVPRLMRSDDRVGSGLHEIFSGYTHSADFSHAAVVAMIDQEHAAQTVTDLRRITSWWAKQDHVSDVSLVGEPVLVDEAFSLVRRDGSRLATITVVLLSLVVTFCLLDLRLVVLLAMVIMWSTMTTKAAMYVAGISLSLIASVLTAIVTVVAVTAVLHLGVQYHKRRSRGFTQQQATHEVMRRMAAPIFWTCATDAAGFAALWFSEILPVRQFGLMIALAALSVFIGIIVFSPTLLMFPEFAWLRNRVSHHHRMTRVLQRSCFRIATFFALHRKITVGTAGILILLSVLIVNGSETETSFLKNFRSNSNIVVDYGNVETHLGGAGVWDLILDAPAPLTNEFLSEVRELQADLLRQHQGPQGLAKAISIADAAEVVGRSGPGRWMPAPVRIAAMRIRLPAFIDALVSTPKQDQPDRIKLRVMLRSAEGLSADQKRMLIDGVEKTATKHAESWRAAMRQESGAGVRTGNQERPAFVTGYYVIMTRLVDQLVSDQWKCFAASAALIWLLMSMATGSIRLATAALIPNLLPAFVVLAMVSLFGGRINMGAAMIAAVSVGLSIDGSVHLLTVYRRRRSLGRDSFQAVRSAAGNIGVAVILATVALVVGFSVLSTSEFIPTATFGNLVAWTLAIGTLINLSVLPALVQSLEKKSKSSL